MEPEEAIHDFRVLVHPLGQIRAAEAFFAQVDSFIADEWSELFVDAPPDGDSIGAVQPSSMLDALASIGLRFDVATQSHGVGELGDDGFWARRFSGGASDSLLYAWAYQVMRFVELDHRAFFEALRWTDLVFVPDRDAVAAEAYQLLLTANPSEVTAAEKKYEDAARSLYRHERSNRSRRGEGPRSSKPAIVDRAAVILRNAKESMAPEEIARRLKLSNLASLTAALHQAVSHGKPKRLAGCLEREGTGRYRWVAE